MHACGSPALRNLPVTPPATRTSFTFPFSLFPSLPQVFLPSGLCEEEIKSSVGFIYAGARGHRPQRAYSRAEDDVPGQDPP